MTETLLTTIASPIITGVVAIVVGVIQSNKTKALIEYKVEQLTKEVNEHNKLIDRTYKLEEITAIHEEKIKIANHRIDDLESKN